MVVNMGVQLLSQQTFKQSTWIVGICCALTAPTSGSQTTPPPTRSGVIIGDARVARSVSLDETGVQIIDLLHKLSDNKLTLDCSASCAQLKLQLRLKRRALSDIMASIADLVPGVWVKLDGDRGYRLEMDEHAITKRDRWWRLFLGEREHALATQKQQVLDALRAEPYRRKPGDPVSPEGADLEIEARRADDQEFFRGLPSALQSRIAAQLNEAPFYGIGAPGFGTNDDEGPVIAYLKELPAGSQDMLRKKVSSYLTSDAPSLDFGKAVVQFNNGGFAVYVSVTFPDGKTSGSIYIKHVNLCQDLLPILADQSRIVEEVKKLGKNAPPAWKRLAEYQNGRVWPNDVPAKPKLVFASARRSANLDRLGLQANIEYIADYYSQGGRPLTQIEKQVALANSVNEEMNSQAARYDFSWKKRTNDIYLIRNNRWYRDDRLEVPEPLIRRWLTSPHSGDIALDVSKLSADEKVPLRIRAQMDWEAEVVSSLTPWQVLTGLRFFAPDDNSPVQSDRAKLDLTGVTILSTRARPINTAAIYPFQRDTTRIMQQYNTSRFYASLDTASRKGLILGNLAFSSLTAAQKQMAAFLVPTLYTLVEVNPPERILLSLRPKSETVRSDGFGIRVRLAVSTQ